MKQDRLTKMDGILALALGVVFGVGYYLMTIPGMDPAIWEEAAAAAGLRPPVAMFPGLWRALAMWLYSWMEMSTVPQNLVVLGSVGGGVMVALAYLIVRHLFAFMVQTRILRAWVKMARFYSVVAALAFAITEPMWRITRNFTPEALRMILVLVLFWLFLRWLNSMRMWMAFVCATLAGVISAETPFGYLVTITLIIGYGLAFLRSLNVKVSTAVELPHPRFLPWWRMFFCYLFAFAAVVALNLSTFESLGGFEANGWSGFEIFFRYVYGTFHMLPRAATPIAWLLLIIVSLAPLTVAIKLFPGLARDDKPMNFRRGLILLVAGAVALLHIGIFPASDFNELALGIIECRSEFLAAAFAFMSATTVAVAGACFTKAMRYVFDYDVVEQEFVEDKLRPTVYRVLVPVVVLALVTPQFFRLPRSLYRESEEIIDAALSETIRECGESKIIYTDGRLDAGLELKAAEMGSPVKPLSMMSTTDSRDKFIRERMFPDPGPDREAAMTGVSTLLRTHVEDTGGTLEGEAAQLGFEFWRAAKSQLPPISGFVVCSSMDEETRTAGIAKATELGERIMALGEFDENRLSPALAHALSSVSWRISRFARQRGEGELADNLDNLNGTVRKMLALIEYERIRSFTQLTAREGLMLALRRQDFAEARRYAARILMKNKDDAEANFGTGMAYLVEDALEEAELYLRRCLTTRPNEPAVLNNLSIICRKLGRLDEALSLAQAANQSLPGNADIEDTLRQAEAAIKERQEMDEKQGGSEESEQSY